MAPSSRYKLFQYAVKPLRFIDEKSVRGPLDNPYGHIRPTFANLFRRSDSPAERRIDEERGPIQRIHCRAQIRRTHEMKIGHHDGGGVGRCRESGFRQSRQIRVRGGPSKHVLDEPARPRFPVQLQALDPLFGERKGECGIDEEGVIHEHQGSDALGAEIVRAHQGFLHTQRPTHDDGRFATEMLEQFADVATAPRRMIPVAGLLRTTLPARVERHDPMSRGEIFQLRFPDPRRHHPARHKHHGRA